MLRKGKSLRPKAATSSATPGLPQLLSHTLTPRPAPNSRRAVRTRTVRPFPLPVASLPVSAPPTAGAVVSGSAQEQAERFLGLRFLGPPTSVNAPATASVAGEGIYQ